MKNIIKDLYKLNRCLLGEGADNTLEYLNHMVDLDIIEIPSGTKLETWTVPDEWVIRDAWVKFKGKKILDYKKNPLCLAVGSVPVNKKMKLEEFKKHLKTNEERPDTTPYSYKLYENDWGFSMPYNKVFKKLGCEGGTCHPELKVVDPKVGKVQIEGDEPPKTKDLLKKGTYEVFIDSEYRPGKLKLGVHTIPGKTDREILLFAHIDHPFQANDNLSGVACLTNIAYKLKKNKYQHTIKIIFGPETIGSIAYAFTQDISKVDFMIALDCVGVGDEILFQKAYNKMDRLNYVAHLAASWSGVSHQKGEFRHVIGSDEYVFNDPMIGIPGLMISRCLKGGRMYREYHTSDDTPEIIKEENLKEINNFIEKIIHTYEKDFIPVRNFKGPLFRSKFGAQTVSPILNRELDYLIYEIDGKKSAAEIISQLGMSFDYGADLLIKLEKHGLISRVENSRSSGGKEE